MHRDISFPKRSTGYALVVLQEFLVEGSEGLPAKSTPIKFHDHRCFHHWKYARPTNFRLVRPRTTSYYMRRPTLIPFVTPLTNDILAAPHYDTSHGDISSNLLIDQNFSPVTEIGKGSKVKYELVHESGLIKDQEQCTDSEFKSKENARKPLFFKELSIVFENVKKGGPFSGSNTLLIDTKPYKAFLNPPNTGIFPKSYVPLNDADKELDPNGELCKFLKGVAEAGDVGVYVKDHPFGQPAISSSHPDWEFYSQVKESIRQKHPKVELCIFLKGVAQADDVQAYVKDHSFGQPAVTSNHPDWEFYSRSKVKR
ncbi:hypothetical protein Fmac_006454 [Flemingia macrophylla]|uniref:FCP1 homology domain-containing protein n=1 Tax=Flemingia macrophylla TaxID=520843 RepID=A0ABD1NAN0_9FABA